jgi:hypothetical protein
VLQGLLDSGASAETFDAWAKTSAEHTS